MTDVLMVLFIFLFAFSVFWIRRSLIHQRQHTRDSITKFDQDMRDARQEWMRAFSHQSQAFQQELHNFNRSLTSSITDTRQSVQTDLKSSGDLMANIHSRLGELSEASKRIFHVGEDIAGLQELLKAPKIRGGMGEYFLEDLLKQILPNKSFSMQYAFKSGEMVDAVIHMGEHLICIDSKFPLESFAAFQNEKDEGEARKLKKEFLRVVKKHAGDISKKYIRPQEGTYDFALMYIPAENIYYETIIRDAKDDDVSVPIFEYAIDKKVIPVSPNSIYAYLQVILIGLKGFQIESQTKEIINKLSGLKNDVGKVQKDFSLAEKHLGRSSNAFEQANKRLSKLGNGLSQLTMGLDEKSITTDENEPSGEKTTSSHPVVID